MNDKNATPIRSRIVSAGQVLDLLIGIGADLAASGSEILATQQGDKLILSVAGAKVAIELSEEV